MAISGIPIQPVQSASGNQWNATRLIEESAQTFLAGTPVSIAAGDGGVQAWNGSTFSGQGAVCGISYEAASNLSATGSGAPAAFGSVGLGAAVGTFGSVPNQSAAKNIAHGAPFNDGRVGFIIPGVDTVFSAILGNAGATVTPANTDVGKSYTLSIDSNSKYWYVNRTVTTANVLVVGLDPRDALASGTRVLFVFIQSTVNLIVF